MELLNVIIGSQAHKIGSEKISPITKAVNHMFMDRVEEITSIITYNDPAFREINDEIRQAEKVLREALPADKSFKLFNAYENATTREETRMLEAVYEQAFKDGIEFYKTYATNTQTNTVTNTQTNIDTVNGTNGYTEPTE